MPNCRWPKQRKTARSVELILNDFSLVMTSRTLEKRESLEITGEYPRSALSQILFSQLGLIELIAPYFPKLIKTNFAVVPEFEKLIAKMYASEGRRPPLIRAPARTKIAFAQKTNPKKVAVADSGGKDSLWNIAWAEKKYGKNNVVPVHIAGLNRGVSSGEKKTAILQAKKLGFKNFRLIGLKKSSGAMGAWVMRSRNVFLTGLIVPLALEFGASKIVIESPARGNEGLHLFTARQKNMNFFNDLLKELGIQIKVIWRDRPAVGVVGDLIKRQPQWLKYVHNCFSPPIYKPRIREGWAKRTPSFPLFESQCGSCVKCRITRLGLLVYGEHAVSRKDAIAFLEHTARWSQEKWPTHEDMLQGSFIRYFERACKIYGVQLNFKPATLG